MRRWSLVLLLLVTGCSAPRGGLGHGVLGSEAGGCAGVLPLARSTVGDGRLVTVHPLRRGQAAALVTAAGATPRPRPTSSPGPSPSPSKGPHLCVVAFQGSYEAARLPTAQGSGSRYAVLVLRVRPPEVRELLLVDRLPAGV